MPIPMGTKVAFGFDNSSAKRRLAEQDPPVCRTLDIATPIHYHMVVDKLSLTFAALSDPTRRAMVHKLTRGPATIHALTQPFNLSQQMISKHVTCLVRADVVVKQKRGRESVCSLSPAAIKSVADWAIDFRRLWEESLDRLDAVLHEMKSEETNRA